MLTDAKRHWGKLRSVKELGFIYILFIAFGNFKVLLGAQLDGYQYSKSLRK